MRAFLEKLKLRRMVSRWATHILLTEWNFLVLPNEEGTFIILLLGELQTMTGLIEIYIVDSTFPVVSVALPEGESFSIGRFLPGSWPWRKLREIKRRDTLISEIAAARIFTGEWIPSPFIEDLPDLPYMKSEDDTLIN